ncbi:2OG-Fe(II) oxygenase [Brevundimonas vesicularis]|uniref:2OG-Fe(II) oxygenase n=1 Tax=Brevundimonas vesicularis TaxID=41276 RepID=UPI0038D4AB39
MSSLLRLAVRDEDFALAAERLARTGRTRLPMLFGDDTRLLYDALKVPDQPWVRTFLNPLGLDVTVEAFEASSPEDQKQFIDSAYAGATDGLQFLFDRLRLGPARAIGSPTPPILFDLLDRFNSDDYMEFARRLTGDERVSFSDGQVTRYLPGHFLNRHSDANPRTERLYAYVLNLSPDWRAEWGGLLQFLDDNGDITETFVPSFGTLNVFAVPQMHAVSTVAPFAGGPRYSVTGWWRAKPLAQA